MVYFIEKFWDRSRAFFESVCVLFLISIMYFIEKIWCVFFQREIEKHSVKLSRLKKFQELNFNRTLYREILRSFLLLFRLNVPEKCARRDRGWFEPRYLRVIRNGERGELTRGRGTNRFGSRKNLFRFMLIDCRTAKQNRLRGVVVGLAMFTVGPVDIY